MFSGEINYSDKWRPMSKKISWSISPQDHPEISLILIDWTYIDLQGIHFHATPFSKSALWQLLVGPYTRSEILCYLHYSSVLQIMTFSGTFLLIVARIWEFKGMLFSWNARSDTDYGGKDSVSCWYVSPNTSLLMTQCLAKVHNVKPSSQEYVLKIPERVQVSQLGRKWRTASYQNEWVWQLNVNQWVW